MGRFSKDNSIEEEAFERQDRRCAVCGDPLEWGCYAVDDEGAWEAHHIDGDPTNNIVENCACVCVHCHFYKCHFGNWDSPSVLDPRDFLFLDG